MQFLKASRDALVPHLAAPRIVAAFLALTFGPVVAPATAQSPTPQQVRQAQQLIQSGVPITPEMVDAAKQQIPELQDIPDDQILKKAEEAKGKTPAEIDKELEKTKQEAKDEESAASAPEEPPIVTRDQSGVGGERRGPGATGFPAGLRRFGEEFFRNADGAEGLGANAPSLPEYIVSPGDEIEVYTWGRESRSQTVTIDADGMFKYPPLDPFRVSGKRFDQAQKQITAEIQKIQGLTVSVRLGRLKSIRIMVLGEAVRPGSYSLPAGITVSAALFRSGGISSIGSLRNIEVRRNGRVASRFDVYDMLLKGDMRGDIQLLPGDAIFIPLAKLQVAVTGNVRRPAIYEVKPGFKALEVIELAGGLDFDAHKGRVRLDRVQNNKRHVVIDVNLDKIDARTNVRLEDGDVLNVERVLSRIEDAVFLEGNVNRPGRYQYKRGMTVRDLIPSLKDLKPETYFEYGHIKRPAPDDDRPTLLSFSLSDVLANGAKVPLEPRDVVVIYNRYDLIERPSVQVSGALRRPGEFLYKEGMTIADLVILAGGLGDAYLPETHLRRVVYDAARDTNYTELIRLNLKEILENPLSEQNLALQPFDVYTVFPRSVFAPTKPVAINGAVKKPGEFAISEGLKLWDLILLAGGLDDPHFAEAHLRREVYIAEIDSLTTQLLRINLKGLVDNPDGPDNISLQPGDAVRIFPRSIGMYPRAASVNGSVRNGGVFELVDNMGIPDIIKLAGGLTKNSYKLQVELVRKTIVKDSVVERTILKMSLKDILDGKVESPPLQDGDGVYIREIVRTRESMRVQLQGQFNFPGVYEFLEGEKLSSVIKRAGGFTPQAYVRGVIFIRESVKQQQLRHAEEVGRRLEGQLQARLQQATNAQEQAGLQLALARRDQLLKDIASAPYLGRVVVQLDARMKFAGTDWDLELESGDRIIVGSQVSTVSVLGEVASPTSLVYTRKTNQVGEVLAKAGGINAYGDYDQTFYIGPDGVITTPNSLPWYSSFKCKKIEAGGTVIVPLKPPAKDYLEIWAQSTQILYQLAITLGVAATLF